MVSIQSLGSHIAEYFTYRQSPAVAKGGYPKFSKDPDKYAASSVPVDNQCITSLADLAAPIQNIFDNPENVQTQIVSYLDYYFLYLSYSMRIWNPTTTIYILINLKQGKYSVKNNRIIAITIKIK